MNIKQLWGMAVRTPNQCLGLVPHLIYSSYLTAKTASQSVISVLTNFLTQVREVYCVDHAYIALRTIT